MFGLLGGAAPSQTPRSTFLDVSRIARSRLQDICTLPRRNRLPESEVHLYFAIEGCGCALRIEIIDEAGRAASRPRSPQPWSRMRRGARWIVHVL
jgi:hypothetical protein